LERPRRYDLLSTLALLCACLALSLPSGAADTASLAGLIYTTGADKVQTVWANARITLKNLKTGAAVSTVSSELGEYSFTGLEPGEYELTVALAGFETEVRRVELRPKAGAHLEIQLRPKAQREEVVVKAHVPGIDVTEASPASPALSQQTLQSAPLVNERFEDALPLIPGVVRGPDGLINIKGARAAQAGTLVNSVSAIDPVTGQSAISLPLEAVESVKVLADPFSAEYGRFAGGITEVQTRKGTDEWKVLFTNFFPRIRVREGSIMGLESITPRLTFAGPLRKGKLYLFQSFDYRFVRTPVSSLPEFRRDQQFETFDSYTQFDWSINANHYLVGSLSLYPQNLKFVNLNTFNPESVTPNFRQRGYFVALNERAIFSRGGFLESSLSVKRYDAHVFPVEALPPEFSLFPEQNFGSWYNRQDRESHLYQWSQTYHVHPVQAGGTHLVELGYSYARSDYDGSVFNNPVVVVREDPLTGLPTTTSQRITFTGLAPLSTDQNQLTFFVQDKWSLHPRFTLTLGARFDRDDLSSDTLNPAPRLAFVFAPTRDNKTAIRGGVGLFYDKIPLGIATFPAYPAETITRFASDGITVVDGPTTFVHRLIATDGGGLHVPYSLAWDFQIDRELGHGVLVRFGYEQRETHRDFVVEPFENASGGQFQLLNNGRQSYREFQWTLRWQARERTTVFTSFVRSRTNGDLNSFEQYFGNYSIPILRPNERGPLPYHAPNRFLFWGTIGLPWKLDFAPVLDVHTGFPFSKVDNDLNFVAPRDRGGRYPYFGALDIQLTRPFKVPFLGRKYKTVAGLKVFNVTNHFNPRDVQQNVDSPKFGALYNSVGRQFRAKLEIEF
jgi:hypothetical protein